MIIQYLHSHWIEIAGTLLSLIYLYLSIRQKIGLWCFGFMSAVLYAVVFFQSKFYADMSLQFYYMAVSIYGWIHWKKGASGDNNTELKVSRTGMREALILTPVTLAILMLYYGILTSFTDSPLPFADSFTTALSITATWMLAQKRLEHWMLWVLVNIVSAVLYLHKGLYPTAVLFLVYTIFSIVGWIQWRKVIS